MEFDKEHMTKQYGNRFETAMICLIKAKSYLGKGSKNSLSRSELNGALESLMGLWEDPFGNYVNLKHPKEVLNFEKVKNEDLEGICTSIKTYLKKNWTKFPEESCKQDLKDSLPQTYLNPLPILPNDDIYNK